MEKIGIIVGNGKLPLYFLKEAGAKGYKVFPIGLFDTIEEEIKEHENFRMMNVGRIGEIIKYLLGNNIVKLVMLGKVEKSILFSDMDFDDYGKKLLEKLPDNKDETLLFGIIALLKLCGIKVLPQNHLLGNFMFKNKVYTYCGPEKKDDLTIKMGMEAAKALSELDAGQTVVCKDSSVVALEGIEGTDQTILRAGNYAGDGCIIIKMARPQQDMRVDIPAVGLDTIRRAIEIKAKGIVGEAGKMLFLDQEEAIKLADENKFFIMGIKP
ncbi:UDP-2,3-diacylglucosamine diphosphatase LpxI domain-containing protein [uncultured Ilyobacter sp.]|uniref:LpxI family protein n=1 Tax=uncultured Ilyobacter sp. TaxID=544433 RepID=UPI0029C0816D|nr:UDP-2,3-diacylglucosamine diphosphatase LpxI [uncultured Ilyobacter sp.]